jgi:hypothetical protein
MTLFVISGTLSMTDKAVQERIHRELQSNPQLVQAAKDQVLSELEAALAQRGITPVIEVRYCECVNILRNAVCS